MPAAPLLSIITVCRDPGPAVGEALASIWHQRGAPRVEIAVIDGASTDGTVAWLQAHRARIDVLHSGPDAGIYDAMNLGLARTTGDWVLFLGADDALASPTTLAQLEGRLRVDDADLIGGRARYSDGRVYTTRTPPRRLRRNPLHHQATFYRRTGFARYGGFDTSLRIAGDYDLNLRWLRGGATLRAIPDLVSQCRAGGLSDAGRWITYREEIAVRHRHANALLALPWDVVSCLRYLRKRVVRHRRQLAPVPS